MRQFHRHQVRARSPAPSQTGCGTCAREHRHERYIYMQAHVQLRSQLCMHPHARARSSEASSGDKTSPTEFAMAAKSLVEHVKSKYPQWTEAVRDETAAANLAWAFIRELTNMPDRSSSCDGMRFRLASGIDAMLEVRLPSSTDAQSLDRTEMPTNMLWLSVELDGAHLTSVLREVRSTVQIAVAQFDAHGNSKKPLSSTPVPWELHEERLQVQCPINKRLSNDKRQWTVM